MRHIKYILLYFFILLIVLIVINHLSLHYSYNENIHVLLDTSYSNAGFEKYDTLFVFVHNIDKEVSIDIEVQRLNNITNVTPLHSLRELDSILEYLVNNELTYTDYNKVACYVSELKPYSKALDIIIPNVKISSNVLSTGGSITYDAVYIWFMGWHKILGEDRYY